MDEGDDRKWFAVGWLFGKVEVERLAWIVIGGVGEVGRARDPIVPLWIATAREVGFVLLFGNRAIAINVDL